jgi:hypothetical protein
MRATSSGAQKAGQVVVSAQLEPQDPLGDIAAPQHDDRNATRFPHFVPNRESIRVWKHDVQYDEIRRIGFECPASGCVTACT